MSSINGWLFRLYSLNSKAWCAFYSLNTAACKKKKALTQEFLVTTDLCVQTGVFVWRWAPWTFMNPIFTSRPVPSGRRSADSSPDGANLLWSQSVSSSRVSKKRTCCSRAGVCSMMQEWRPSAPSRDNEPRQRAETTLRSFRRQIRRLKLIDTDLVEIVFHFFMKKEMSARKRKSRIRNHGNHGEDPTL